MRTTSDEGVGGGEREREKEEREEERERCEWNLGRGRGEGGRNGCLQKLEVRGRKFAMTHIPKWYAGIRLPTRHPKVVVNTQYG